MRETSMAKRVSKVTDLYLAGRLEDALRVATTGRKVDVAAIAASVAVCLAAVDATRPNTHGPPRAQHFAAALVRAACFTDELDDRIAENRRQAGARRGGPPYDAATATGMYDHD